MINILKVEFKRMIKTKSNIIVFGIGIMIIAFLAFYIINIQTSSSITLDGRDKTLTGLNAIMEDTKEQSKVEGDVTGEKFLDTLNKYKELQSKYKDNIPSEIYTKELSSYKELINILPYSFSNLANRINSKMSFDLQYLSDKEAYEFYNQRRKNQKFEYEEILKLNDNAQKYLESMEKKVKKPFYFSPFSGWDTFVEFLGFSIMIIAFVGCILVTPVFSREYKNKSDEIMRCTKYGRKHLAISKLIISNVIVLCIYIVSIIVFYGIAYRALNANGLDTSIQFISPLSPIPLTFGKTIFIIMIVGLITVLSIANFTLFLSSRSKSSIFIISISSIVIILPMALNIIIDPKVDNTSNIIKFLINMFPSGGTRIFYELLNINLFQIGNFNIWSPYIIVISAIVTLIGFFSLSVYSYIKGKAI